MEMLNNGQNSILEEYATFFTVNPRQRRPDTFTASLLHNSIRFLILQHGCTQSFLFPVFMGCCGIFGVDGLRGTLPGRSTPLSVLLFDRI